MKTLQITLYFVYLFVTHILTGSIFELKIYSKNIG